MNKGIYLDNNASTCLDPRVLKVMVDHLSEDFGNPSSIHFFGQNLRNKLTVARRAIASYLNVKPAEIVFTSGGTESVNMVIQGILNYSPGHVISSSVEHSSVYNSLQLMESRGCKVTYLNPGLWGAVTPEAVSEAIQPDTKLITLMSVNNETGVKTDIEAIAQIAERRGILFVVDGIAHLGKEPFKISSGVSAMCFSGHKLHAPKGIGMVFIRKKVKSVPLLVGGTQEHQRRGGTENLIGILALAEAVQFLETELPISSEKMHALRDRLEEGIRSAIPDVVINGQAPRVVNTTNLSFKDVDGESLLMSLDLEGLAVSHGSACSSGSLEPSRILLNMGIPLEQARSSIRFSLSRFTTAQEIEDAIAIVTRVVTRLRKIGKK